MFHKGINLPMGSMDGAKKEKIMALNKKLAMMIMGPKMMSHSKEEKAEKAGKKGFPMHSAKEEAKEQKSKKGRKC